MAMATTPLTGGMTATVRCQSCGARESIDTSDRATIRVAHECFVRTLGVTGVDDGDGGIAWWRVDPEHPLDAELWDPLSPTDPAAIEAQARYDAGGGRIITEADT
jgi:hypothetical protein